MRKHSLAKGCVVAADFSGFVMRHPAPLLSGKAA